MAESRARADFAFVERPDAWITEKLRLWRNQVRENAA
jgi:hypothetical protein